MFPYPYEVARVSYVQTHVRYTYEFTLFPHPLEVNRVSYQTQNVFKLGYCLSVPSRGEWGFLLSLGQFWAISQLVSVPSRGNWGFLQKKNGKKKSLAIAVYVLLRGEWGFLLKIYVLTKEETFCFRPLARWMGVLTNIATMKNCSLDRFRPLSRWLGCLTDLNKWAREEMTELPSPLEVIGVSNWACSCWYVLRRAKVSVPSRGDRGF